jgi:nucleoid-associated protein YgaU
MADPRFISCEAAGFDCESSSISGGKLELNGRKKAVLGSLIAIAFVASMMLGFFVLGPVVQNAMVDSEGVNHSHGHTLGKAAYALSSMPLRPSSTMARATEPVMAAKKAAKKAAPKKAAPKKVVKKAAPARKKAAPAPAPKKTGGGGFFSIFENSPGMLQKKKGTNRFLERKDGTGIGLLSGQPKNNDGLYYYGGKGNGRNVYPYSKRG